VIFLSASFEKPKRYTVSAEINPRDPRDKAQSPGTALSQIYAIRQSMIPTKLHIKPASVISQYLDTAGFNFSRVMALPFEIVYTIFKLYSTMDGQPASISITQVKRFRVPR